MPAMVSDAPGVRATGAFHPVRLTPLHHVHQRLSAKMVEREGWWVPDRYGDDPLKEVDAAESSVGVSDISALAKIEIKGEGTSASLTSLLSRPSSVPPMPGQVVYRPELADPTLKRTLIPRYVCRLAPDQALVIARGEVPRGANPMDVATAAKPVRGAYLTNITSVLAGISVCGPDSFEVISRLTEVDVSPETLRARRCAQVGFANVVAIVVRADGSRDGKSVQSYDVFFGRENAEYVWDSIFGAGGAECKVTPVGLSAYELIHGGESKTGGSWDAAEGGP